MISTLEGFSQILQFGAQQFVCHLDKVDLSYNIFQAALNHRADENPKFFQKLDRYRAVFFTADSFSMLFTAIRLAADLENKYHLMESLIATSYGDGVTCMLSAVLVSSAALGILASCQIDKFAAPYLDLGIPNITLSRPNRETIKQFLYVARIAIKGLIFFSPQGPFYALSAAVQIYSLIKLTAHRWVEFKNEGILIPSAQVKWGASRVSSTYFFLIHSMKGQPTEDCSVCLEPNPSIYFCPSHTFHPECVVDTIKAKAQSFLNGLEIRDKLIIETEHRTNGVRTHSTYSAEYTVGLQASNVPCCPLCRFKPVYNDFIVKINDHRYGWSSTQIEWIGN